MPAVGILSAMKRLLSILLICLVISSCDRKSQTEKWTNQESWQKLEKGMTDAQVTELFGKPKQVIRRAVMRWDYQESPREIGTEPKWGFILFENKGTHKDPKWFVRDWEEPNWRELNNAEN